MRIFLYLCPILINYILGGVSFIAADRFARAGASEITVGATMTVWSLIYTVSSFIIGRRTSERNAPYMVITGALLIALNMIGFLVFDSLYLQFLWLAMNGVCFALYCCPFQVFMKMMESSMGTEKQKELSARSAVVRSASFYTASWSIGMAIGPFIFGFFEQKLVYGINIGISLALAAGLFLMNEYRKKRTPVQTTETAAAVRTDEKQEMPDMVRCAWALGLLASFTITTLRTMVPVRAVELHLSTSDAGTIIFAAVLMQCIMALFLVCIRGNWMYRPVATMIPISCGIFSMLGFAFGNSMLLFMIAAVLFGICTGASFFLLVFHALIHPTKSGAYVAMNEVVDGTTNMISPLIGGFVMTMTGFTGSSFLLAAVVILGVVIYTTNSFRKISV